MNEERERKKSLELFVNEQRMYISIEFVAELANKFV